jgi:hypothetical protein
VTAVRALAAVVALPQALAEPPKARVVEGSLGQPTSRRHHLGPVRLTAPLHEQRRPFVLTVGKPVTSHVAVEAGQYEVVECDGATLRPREYVVDRAGTVAFLGECEAAIPAPVAVTLDQARDSTRAALAAPNPLGMAQSIP